MNWLDLLLGFILIAAALSGAKKGLIRTVVGFAALVIGIVVAARYYPEFGGWLQSFISSRTWSRGIAFILILLGVVVGGSIVSSILGGVASAIGLGVFNRIGGAAAGVAIAVVVSGGVLSLVSSLQGSLGLRLPISGSFLASFLIDRAMPVLGSLSPFFGDPLRWFEGLIP